MSLNYGGRHAATGPQNPADFLLEVIPDQMPRARASLHEIRRVIEGLRGTPYLTRELAWMLPWLPAGIAYGRSRAGLLVDAVLAYRMGAVHAISPSRIFHVIQNDPARRDMPGADALYEAAIDGRVGLFDDLVGAGRAAVELRGAGIQTFAPWYDAHALLSGYLVDAPTPDPDVASPTDDPISIAFAQRRARNQTTACYYLAAAAFQSHVIASGGVLSLADATELRYDGHLRLLPPAGSMSDWYVAPARRYGDYTLDAISPFTWGCLRQWNVVERAIDVARGAARQDPRSVMLFALDAYLQQYAPLLPPRIRTFAALVARNWVAVPPGSAPALPPAVVRALEDRESRDRTVVAAARAAALLSIADMGAAILRGDWDVVVDHIAAGWPSVDPSDIAAVGWRWRAGLRHMAVVGVTADATADDTAPVTAETPAGGSNEPESVPIGSITHELDPLPPLRYVSAPLPGATIVAGGHTIRMEGVVVRPLDAISADGVITRPTAPREAPAAVQAPAAEPTSAERAAETPRAVPVIVDSVDSVLQRTFTNGSRMIFSFAGLDADRTRGISAPDAQPDLPAETPTSPAARLDSPQRPRLASDALLSVLSGSRDRLSAANTLVWDLGCTGYVLEGLMAVTTWTPGAAADLGGYPDVTERYTSDGHTRTAPRVGAIAALSCRPLWRLGHAVADHVRVLWRCASHAAWVQATASGTLLLVLTRVTAGLPPSADIDVDLEAVPDNPERVEWVCVDGNFAVAAASRRSSIPAEWFANSHERVRDYVRTTTRADSTYTPHTAWWRLAVAASAIPSSDVGAAVLELAAVWRSDGAPQPLRLFVHGADRGGAVQFAAQSDMLGPGGSQRAAVLELPHETRILLTEALRCQWYTVGARSRGAGAEPSAAHPALPGDAPFGIVMANSWGPWRGPESGPAVTFRSTSGPPVAVQRAASQPRRASSLLRGVLPSLPTAAHTRVWDLGCTGSVGEGRAAVAGWHAAPNATFNGYPDVAAYYSRTGVRRAAPNAGAISVLSRCPLWALARAPSTDSRVRVLWRCATHAAWVQATHSGTLLLVLTDVVNGLPPSEDVDVDLDTVTGSTVDVSWLCVDGNYDVEVAHGAPRVPQFWLNEQRERLRAFVADTTRPDSAPDHTNWVRSAVAATTAAASGAVLELAAVWRRPRRAPSTARLFVHGADCGGAPWFAAAADMNGPRVNGSPSARVELAEIEYEDRIALTEALRCQWYSTHAARGARHPQAAATYRSSGLRNVGGWDNVTTPPASLYAPAVSPTPRATNQRRARRRGTQVDVVPTTPEPEPEPDAVDEMIRQQAPAQIHSHRHTFAADPLTWRPALSPAEFAALTTGTFVRDPAAQAHADAAAIMERTAHATAHEPPERAVPDGQLLATLASPPPHIQTHTIGGMANLPDAITRPVENADAAAMLEPARGQPHALQDENRRNTHPVDAAGTPVPLSATEAHPSAARAARDAVNALQARERAPAADREEPVFDILHPRPVFEPDAMRYQISSPLAPHTPTPAQLARLTARNEVFRAWLQRLPIQDATAAHATALAGDAAQICAPPGCPIEACFDWLSDLIDRNSGLAVSWRLCGAAQAQRFSTEGCGAAGWRPPLGLNGNLPLSMLRPYARTALRRLAGVPLLNRRHLLWPTAYCGVYRTERYVVLATVQYPLGAVMLMVTPDNPLCAQVMAVNSTQPPVHWLDRSHEPDATLPLAVWNTPPNRDWRTTARTRAMDLQYADPSGMWHLISQDNWGANGYHDFAVVALRSDDAHILRLAAHLRGIDRTPPYDPLPDERLYCQPDGLLFGRAHREIHDAHIHSPMQYPNSVFYAEQLRCQTERVQSWEQRYRQQADGPAISADAE